MKLLAINGSPRKDGNTFTLLNTVMHVAEHNGIATEMIHLSGESIRGCNGCGACFSMQNTRCVFTNDIISLCIEKMLESDAIVIGSPTYFADVTTEVKALIDRAGMVAKANHDMFRHKLGAAVIAVRRGGEIHAFNTINNFFLISQMIVPGSSYWNMGFGLEKGDVEHDEEGIKTMNTLGENLVWLLLRLRGK